MKVEVKGYKNLDAFCTLDDAVSYLKDEEEYELWKDDIVVYERRYTDQEIFDLYIEVAKEELKAVGLYLPVDMDMYGMGETACALSERDFDSKEDLIAELRTEAKEYIINDVKNYIKEYGEE